MKALWLFFLKMNQDDTTPAPFGVNRGAGSPTMDPGRAGRTSPRATWPCVRAASAWAAGPRFACAGSDDLRRRSPGARSRGSPAGFSLPDTASPATLVLGVLGPADAPGPGLCEGRLWKGGEPAGVSRGPVGPGAPPLSPVVEAGALAVQVAPARNGPCLPLSSSQPGSRIRPRLCPQQ